MVTTGEHPVTTTQEVKIPRFRTCPLCKLIKSEVQFRLKVFIDGKSTKVCATCYSAHVDNSYVLFG